MRFLSIIRLNHYPQLFVSEENFPLPTPHLNFALNKCVHTRIVWINWAWSLYSLIARSLYTALTWQYWQIGAILGGNSDIERLRRKKKNSKSSCQAVSMIHHNVQWIQWSSSTESLSKTLLVNNFLQEAFYSQIHVYDSTNYLAKC